MKYARYPVIASADHHMYFFFSEGIRGKIAKGIVYSLIEGDLFNLSFGDWNEKIQDLDDSTRSNNGDRDKVLAHGSFYGNRFYRPVSRCQNIPGRQHFCEDKVISNGDRR